MNRRVVVGVSAGILGIAALLWGLHSTQWVIGTDFGIETHVGLRVMEQCQTVQPRADAPDQKVCSTFSHGDIARSASKYDGFDTFSLVSHLTFYTGLIAVAVVLLVMLLALLGRFPNTAIAPSTVAIMLSTMTLLLTGATLSINPWKEIGWGTGSSSYLAGVGAAACLAASIVLGRLRPPVQDSW
ncbi:MAG TPA: hypothetical protein VKB80_30600 [Kofleriaceae bacterium]|nr:hypothetical protein [Kofleriaceae bacterium]